MYIESFYFNDLENVDDGFINMDVGRVQYYKDLHLRYHIDFSVNNKKKIYSYEFLSGLLFDVVKNKNFLSDIAWVLFPRHGYNWDGGHVSQELYLKNKYCLKSNLLDIRDCGSLCVYQAISLAKSLNKNVLIVSIEMDSIFKNFPYIGFLEIRKNRTSSKNFYIDYCNFFYTKNKNSLKNFVNLMLKNFEISLEDVFIVSHKNFGFCFDSAFLYKALSVIDEKNKDRKYLLIVDQEMSLQRYAVVLLRKG
ncbi:MAG: hypothetical protein Q8L78_03785 [Coxiellaceae bacterium]|nr:hypothetical protein [Coxiellaceae bacterium]